MRGAICLSCASGTDDISEMNVIPSKFELLAAGFETAQLRHKVIAHNIANVNTPGYKQLQVEFEDQLQKRLASENPGPGRRDVDLAGIEPAVVEGPSLYFRADGNNVDISGEIGRMNKNVLLHNTFAQIMTNKLVAMRSAMRLGG